MFHNVRISPQKKYRSHCYSLLCSIHLPTTSEYLNKCVNTKLKIKTIHHFHSCLFQKNNYQHGLSIFMNNTVEMKFNSKR